MEHKVIKSIIKIKKKTFNDKIDILKLTWKEIKRIFSNKILVATFFVVLLLPLLYGCLYLWAFWDPYSRLNELPIAVVNEDSGYNYEDNSYNFGNEVISELKNNNVFNWNFVSNNEAKDGLMDKKYYAELLIPDTFSKDIMSINSSNPYKAYIKLIPRQSNNLIASQLMDSASKQLCQKISEEITSKILTNIFANIKDSIKKAADGSNQLYSAISQAYNGTIELNNGIETAYNGSKQITDGSSQINDGVSKINNAPGILKFFANLFLPGLKNGVSKLNNGTNDLYNGSKNLSNGIGKIYNGSNQLLSGISQIKDGAYDFSTQLNSGSQEIENKLNDNSIDFLSNPVEIETEIISPVPNYGTGFSPYFMSLGLWVGALMVFFLIKARRMPNEESNEEMEPYKITFAKTLTLGFISIIQSVFLVTFLILILGLRPQNILLTYLFTVLSSFCFFSIIHFFVLLFGNIGKFVSIVLLMLQLTSSAGTFPLELTPEFFKIINVVLPMTYTVGGLREIISGGNYHFILIYSLILFGFIIIFNSLSLMISKNFLYRKDIELA